jgi:hypothetical protein
MWRFFVFGTVVVHGTVAVVTLLGLWAHRRILVRRKLYFSQAAVSEVVSISDSSSSLLWFVKNPREVRAGCTALNPG